MACKPNNVEILSGDYVALLGSTASSTLQKGDVEAADWDTTWNVDCRDLTKRERKAIGLENGIKACKDGFEHETWLLGDGFYGVTEPIEPTRSEAIINYEGDFQLTVHQPLPKGDGEARFAFAIDPVFQPVQCEQTDNGVKRANFDGDWIGEWSKSLKDLDPEQYPHLADYIDDEGARLFFLNAFTYQLDPENTGTTWNFPMEWVAGSAQGKFGEEFLVHRTSRYGLPRLYNALEDDDFFGYLSVEPTDLFYCAYPLSVVAEENAFGQAPPTRVIPHDECMDFWAGRANTVSDEILTDYSHVLSPTTKPEDTIVQFRPIVHSNDWREADDNAEGLDGWTEMSYSYVVFSGDSDLVEGGYAKGVLNIIFETGESQTRVFVQSEFEIEKIKKERWVNDDLRTKKAEENGYVICGDTSGGEEEK